MSFPVYIIDDGKIFFKEEKDFGHNEFWEEEVSLYVAKKFKVSLQHIINLPYCQKRGRLVNEKFYFGEKPNKLIKNLCAFRLSSNLYPETHRVQTGLAITKLLFLQHCQPQLESATYGVSPRSLFSTEALGSFSLTLLLSSSSEFQC